jgi:inosine/xanthosine triphosphate pyrophosphatase family protein
MSALTFVTTNADKYKTAAMVCQEKGISLSRRPLDVFEVQSEDPELILRDKAEKAYAGLKAPIIVSDDCWSFTGLHGFPGPYMHSMNKWLSPEDFLLITKGLSDKRAVLTQRLAYAGGKTMKIFARQHEATILSSIQGYSPYACHTVISLNADNGLSIADALSLPDRGKHVSADVWHEFADWFTRMHVSQ